MLLLAAPRAALTERCHRACVMGGQGESIPAGQLFCATPCLAAHVASGVNHLGQAGFVGAEQHCGHSQQSRMGMVFPSQEPGAWSLALLSLSVALCTPMPWAGRGRMADVSPNREERSGWVRARSVPLAALTPQHLWSTVHVQSALQTSLRHKCSSLSPSCSS